MFTRIEWSHNRPLHDNCGITALLQGKMIFFAEIAVVRQLNVVNEIIDVTSYFTKPCYFALQKSSTAVTVKGLIRKCVTTRYKLLRYKSHLLTMQEVKNISN